MGDSTTTLRTLKDATRAMHERLESAPRLARLTDLNLSREEYCDVLERLLGYHEPAELALVPHADRLPLDFGARRKTHLLVRDLERLRYSRQAIDELPCCPDVAPVTDVDSALGVLYVLDGSTLGGRIIRRHLQRSIGITPGAGGAYFTGYGENTGPMWKELGRAIKKPRSRNPFARAHCRIGMRDLLEDLLGIGVDVVTENALHPILRSKVLTEAVEL